MAPEEEPLFFKIGEAAARVGVPSHVLRFWTKEFPQLEPARIGGRHRLYRAGDLKVFLAIKRLLYEERFTIEGARKRLAEENIRTRAENTPAPQPASKPGRKTPAKNKEALPDIIRPGPPVSADPGLLAEIYRELTGIRALLTS
ncbi:MAG: MerR family transcriptional regulator [Deltaproteobacteria bacterium]|jgi:DNA-binding transcriptional MerR regulator|nr:MerR family transcriptional regulator [Deltaproteobacteria bacterium]